MAEQWLTLKDFIKSETANRRSINNTPGVDVFRDKRLTKDYILNNMRNLCTHILNPLKEQFPGLYLTSGYRCKEVNSAINGDPKSQHIHGMAADVICTLGTPTSEIFNWVINNTSKYNEKGEKIYNGKITNYYQMIWEYPELGNYGVDEDCSWIHISYYNNYYKMTSRHPDNVVATKNKKIREHYGGNSTYTKWLQKYADESLLLYTKSAAEYVQPITPIPDPELHLLETIDDTTLVPEKITMGYDFEQIIQEEFGSKEKNREWWKKYFKVEFNQDFNQ